MERKRKGNEASIQNWKENNDIDKRKTKLRKMFIFKCLIYMCSGITHGRVLNGELYTDAQRLQKLIYLH